MFILSGFGCPPGSDVPVCAGLERRLGQHHVPWTGRSGDRPAGKNNTGTNLYNPQNEHVESLVLFVHQLLDFLPLDSGPVLSGKN